MKKNLCKACGGRGATDVKEKPGASMRCAHCAGTGFEPATAAPEQSKKRE